MSPDISSVNLILRQNQTKFSGRLPEMILFFTISSDIPVTIPGTWHVFNNAYFHPVYHIKNVVKGKILYGYRVFYKGIIKKEMVDTF